MIRCLVILALLIPMTAHAFPLITPEEAAVPAATPKPLTRGITRGPAITLDSPRAPIRSPFRLHVVFTAHGGDVIDPASIRVIYLRSRQIDISARLQPFTTGAGITVDGAEVPPGEHAFRIELRDDAGHESSADIVLKVAG
jgi:hypothetical protein